MELKLNAMGETITTSVEVKDNITLEEKENVYAEMALSNAYDIITELMDEIDYARNKEFWFKVDDVRRELYNLWKQKFDETKGINRYETEIKL